MRHEFIDGSSSSSTYLIIGRRKGDNLRLAIRRLARNDGTAVYRIHVYPTMRDFGLDAPETQDDVAYHAQRDDYETLHMRGDAAVRDYLLPALAARGVEALEFDSAVTALKAHSPGDNEIAQAYGTDMAALPESNYDPSAIGIGHDLDEDGEGAGKGTEGLGTLGYSDVSSADPEDKPDPDNIADPDDL